MPHLLMSNESLRTSASRPRSSPVSRIQNFRRSAEVDPDLEPLRQQVGAIIDAILADTKPEEAEVREKLRWHVADNPGKPEKALLSHLLSMPVRQDASA
ncbi:hypothetical protein ACX80S_11000 [Arthrobacter sp. RHLT1-20]